MKHGDKAKKSAKGKAPTKKASAKVTPPVKSSEVSRPRGQVVAKSVVAKTVVAKTVVAKTVAVGKAADVTKTGVPKTVAAKPAPASNGKNAARIIPGVVGFSNPVVANAFKRAVKKYPTAFRRLTD